MVEKKREPGAAAKEDKPTLNNYRLRLGATYLSLRFKEQQALVVKCS